MEIDSRSIELKTRQSIQLPLNQVRKQIVIDVSNKTNSKTTLISYQIRLIYENRNVFVYLFKNIDPHSIWYEKKIREGDRLISLNEQDTITIPPEQIYSIMTDENQPTFKCEVIWHPELYMEFISETDNKHSNEFKRMINENLYEYLTKTVNYLLDYQPKNACLFVEKLLPTIESNKISEKQFNLLLNRTDIVEDVMKNMLEVHYLFEQIDVGLNRDEIYWIWLLMRSLLKEKENIQKLRFWGKIFGLQNDYYIFEVESEYVQHEVEEETESLENEINPKIFFVTTELDQSSFVQLPLLTSEQIEYSHRIQQFFTGDLEAKVKNDESFPGVEKHLLHAQIQRITSETHIRPKNDEEDTIDHMTNSFEDLALPNGQYWIHCNIKNEQKYPVSIDNDSKIDDQQSAWSINVKHTFISIRSNRWPGAVTVSDQHRFENIYIGWAVKNLTETHQANMIDRLPENEYSFELNELDDPTVDDENELFKPSILLSPNDDDDEEFDND